MQTVVLPACNLLLFVRRAQSLGMTLKEIKPLLNAAVRGEVPCNHVKQLVRRHLHDVEDKIRQLQSLRSELRIVLQRKTRRPHANEVCRIIERN
jgi:MerR family transcriptional regulator, copper efflux regulator